MTLSTSHKTLNQSTSGQNTSGSKNKPQAKSHTQVRKPVNTSVANKPAAKNVKANYHSSQHNKPTTSPKTATSQQSFVKSPKNTQQQITHTTIKKPSSASKQLPSQQLSTQRIAVSSPIIKSAQPSSPKNTQSSTASKPAQHKKKFFIKPKQSLSQGQSINNIVSNQIVSKQSTQKPSMKSGVGFISIKRLLNRSSSFIRKISSPHNILFLGFLLCSSAILGYIMSSLVKFQLARGSLGPNQPTLSIMNLSDLSLFAGSDDPLNASGTVTTGINQTGVADIPDITPSVIEAVIAPNRDKTVSDLIQGYYKALGDDGVQITQRIMPGLNNRPTYQQYFNPTRVARFKAGLTIEGLRVQNISIVAQKNEIPTQILYELHYTRSSNSQKYTEQRRVDLRNTADGLRISKLFCETKGCSRHPFYRLK